MAIILRRLMLLSAAARSGFAHETCHGNACNKTQTFGSVLLQVRSNVLRDTSDMGYLGDPGRRRASTLSPFCPASISIPSPPSFPRRRRGAPYMRQDSRAGRRRASCNQFPQKKGADLFFEDGTIESGLDCPLEDSYSINKDSRVKKGSRAIEADDYKNLQVVKVDWAREGNYVLKVFADGSNYPRKPYGYRSELGSVYNCYTFKPEQYYYYTMSFWPDESWCQRSHYSTVISQFKMASDPHAILKLSNLGDYKLTFKSGRGQLWDEDDGKNGKGEGKFIGFATPRAWNDIKIYAKWSLRDGFIKVWLNSTLVFSHSGRTLLEAKDRGYVKFGLYTEIYDKRTIYFDAVRFANFLDVPFEQWVSDQANLPTVSLSSPSNGSQVASGSSISITADANDPGGAKYGSPGSISHVEFFAGTCSVGVVRERPWSVAFSAPDGSYSLTAKVTDGDGNTQISGITTVYFGKKPPRVEILAPGPDANLPTGSDVPLRAKALSEDGVVSSVEFFIGNSAIASTGEHMENIFSSSWEAPQAGAYALQAVATSRAGAIGRSRLVHFTVGAELATTTVTATDDATVQESRTSSTGNWGEVEVYGKPGGLKVGLIQFDVSSFHGAPEIRNAVMRLFATKIKDNKPTDIAVFSACCNEWEERRVTWSSKPAKGEKLTAMLINKKNRWYDFDVTLHIAHAVAAGTNRITFWLEEESQEYKRVDFDSLRRSNKPQLAVTTSSIPRSTAEEETEPSPEDLCNFGTTKPPASTSSTTASATTMATTHASDTTSVPWPTESSTTTSSIAVPAPCPKAEEIASLKKELQRIANRLQDLADDP